MNLVINKNKYYVPINWNEVNLESYMNFMLTHDANKSETEQEIHLLSTLTGAPAVVLQEAKKSTINSALDRLKELMQKEPSEDLILRFKIDNIEYGFHPNLADMKLKEFVDLDNKLTEVWQNMHSVLSILYRPIKHIYKEKYTIEDYDYITATKRAELFKKELSVDVVNAAAAFFLTIAVDYMKITQAYSKLNRKQKRHATKQMKKFLTKNMAGTA